jgi:flagellin-like hook-associated protein FlgL
MQQASQTATTQLNNVTQALSSIRDSDIATDATQLTLDKTAMDAALSAHGSLNTKSLFSYLG